MNQENDLDHIIGKPPGWGMRWGLWVVLAAMALLVLAAALISYADVVEAPAMLTTEQPPFRVVASETRTIGELLVEDGETVSVGDPLLLWKSDAVFRDVKTLENSLQNTGDLNLMAAVFGKWSRTLHLGSIEAAFIAVRKAARQLTDHENDVLYQSRLKNLRNQVAGQNALAVSLQRQEQTLREELQLAADNVAKDSTLLARHSLSESEFLQTSAFYLRKKRELETLQTEMLKNRLMGKQLEARILDLQQLHEEAGKAARLGFETALLELKASIENWKNSHIPEAPAGGKVQMPQQRRKGQVIAAGEVILRIVPKTGEGEVPHCRAWIPANAIAKVAPGLEARIRLEAYPWQQYGELEARLTNVAEAAENGAYPALLDLTQGLTTTQGMALKFHHEMTGTVRITTEKRNLLKRLFAKLKR